MFVFDSFGGLTLLLAVGNTLLSAFTQAYGQLAPTVARSHNLTTYAIVKVLQIVGN
jgi:hypothetical protein